MLGHCPWSCCCIEYIVCVIQQGCMVACSRLDLEWAQPLLSILLLPTLLHLLPHSITPTTMTQTCGGHHSFQEPSAEQGGPRWQSKPDEQCNENLSGEFHKHRHLSSSQDSEDELDKSGHDPPTPRTKTHLKKMWRLLLDGPPTGQAHIEWRGRWGKFCSQHGVLANVI